MIGETSFFATARFEDGEPKIKVTAVTPYGNRSASVDVEVTDEKLLSKLGSVMAAAIKSVRGDLQHRSVTEAARAAVVAGDKGESIYAK